jgi:hypothetical protein
MIDGFDAVAIALVGIGGYLLGSASRSKACATDRLGGYQPVQAPRGNGLMLPPHQGSGAHRPCCGRRKASPPNLARKVYDCSVCDDTGYKDYAGFAMELCDCRRVNGA